MNEQEEANEILAARDVALNHLLQLGRGLFAALGITVARKVHQMPLAVDAEMVDEHRLARGGRGHGQTLAPRQHIDKTALADIAAANEGVFGKGRGGTLLYTTTANDKFSALDIHNRKIKGLSGKERRPERKRKVIKPRKNTVFP